MSSGSSSAPSASDKIFNAFFAVSSKIFRSSLAIEILSIIILVAVIFYSSKLKWENKLPNQLFVILLIFWIIVIVISAYPSLLDDFLSNIGLENRAQFLLVITVIVLLYVIYTQMSKNKNLSLDINRIISDIAISNFKQNANELRNSIVLLIPALNEVKSLPKVLSQIPSELLNHKISVVVIDDGSSDETFTNAKSKIIGLKNALGGSILGRISSLLNFSNLKKFKKRLDPRLYNGAIFIGLDSPVVKSHGGTDYIGFSNSLDVCNRIIKGNLIDKIRENI